MEDTPKRSPGKCFGLLCCWLVIAAPAQAGPERWQGKTLTFQPLPNSSPWIHAEYQGSVLVAQLSGDRLFRSRKPTAVVVRRVRRDRNHVEFQLESEHLGKGKIEFRDAAGWSEQSWATVLSLLFRGEGIPEVANFVGHTGSLPVHFRGANHLPAEDMRQQFSSLEETRHAGFRPCLLCVKWFPGFSGFEQDLFFGMLCGREANAMGPQTSDAELQQRFLRAGREVVELWPLPPRGYRYRFFVLDSDVTNAAACPEGQIFITTALLEALETDQELKAV